MKKLVVFLNTLIALYFFLLANIYCWGSILVLLSTSFSRPELLQNPWTFVINILLSPFFIYAAIQFFRKTESKYNYGLFLLLFNLAETQIYRFFFVTGHKLEMTDLSNLVFFGMPLMVIYLTKHLNTTYVLKS